MPNQRSRNSRDDKSGPNKRTTRATGGRKPAFSEKPAYGEKKNFGEDKKSFGPKKREFGANREEKPRDFTPRTNRTDFKKKGILAFVQVAEHPEKVEILKEDPIPTNLGLLKETRKEQRHVVSGTTALLVGRESLMATAQHVEPIVMPQDLTANVHRMVNENHIAIVHHAERMAKEIHLDHIRNAVLLENAPILKHWPLEKLEKMPWVVKAANAHYQAKTMV